MNEILEWKRKDLAELKRRFPIHRVRRAVEHRSREDVRSFRKAICNPKRLNLICELKKASPSQGILCEDFQPLRIASLYEHAQAAAISILTESHFFKGRPSYLKTVRQVTTIPLLRKDFIFESYQLYESALLEADAFLLISSILTPEELSSLIKLGNELGMDALVEVHTDEDLRKAMDAGAEIIGINNRNLRTLTVDPRRARQLIPQIPKTHTIVVESGLTTHEELLGYKSLGVSSFLIGTVLMKSKDVVSTIDQLMGKDKKWKAG
ncbi:MAG: indole-3-glycerol phosphate synthase TrpC [Candidatus Omnitrophota bacterium]|nr:indole-3-glycerol phosphate synthase TrpC [Candidatus Omnitrophota bacterium]